MKRKTILTCLALALAALALTNPKTVAVSVEASPPVPAESVTAVPLYWFTENKKYSVINNVAAYRDVAEYAAFHFYTIVEDEKAALQTQPQWSFMGVVGYVFPKQVSVTVPLSRLGHDDYARRNT